jgi:translation initiation factor IF-3
MSKKQKKNTLFFKTNNQIRVPEVRLVGDNIDTGVYDTQEAKDIADQLDLDLIEISPNANPPVCKIQEYSKFLYDMKRKQREQEKKNRQNSVEVKELRFGPNTDDHDFNFKKNHAESFLKRGDKVKAFVFFKGREMMFKEKGQILLLKLADQLEDVGMVESMPKMEGNKMIMFIRPKK